jgi:hypothetical protein
MSVTSLKENTQVSPQPLPMKRPASVNEWTFRDEILAVAHRWPVPFLAFLIGSLVGWGCAYLFPTTYRAEMNLYVGYNADQIYRNPDDYKNWQMRQINDLATTDDVLNEVLARLRGIDPYWKNINLDDFQSMLKVLWRNTGKWRLVVETTDPNHSLQAAQVWSDVFMLKYNLAKVNAFEITNKDKNLQALAGSIAEVRLRRAQLTNLQQSLQSWQEHARQLPGDQPLDEFTRWQLWSIAAGSADLDPAWRSLLQDFPTEDTVAAGYFDWLQKLSISLDERLGLAQTQFDSLGQEYDQVYQAYQAVVDASRGLSANVDVGELFLDPNRAQALRPTGLTALVGGILGFLTWGLFWLALPILRASK